MEFPASGHSHRKTSGVIDIQVWMVGHPDNLRSISWVGEEGWKEGLPIATEDCLTTSDTACTTRKRWTWTDWHQDDEEAAFPINPIVTETQVGDTSNVKRTTIDYYTDSGTYPFRLPETVKVYGPDLSTVIKQSHTEYDIPSASVYTDRRIIGLPKQTEISGTDSDSIDSCRP